ncbi:MAG: hypothetical protein ACFE85_14340 [Candidatus Hodarchaeota archaeon]
MAIINQNVQSQICELNEYLSLKVICPVCKSQKELKFPKSVINQSRQLTTISIPKNLVCKHHFQAFVDKNFIVRGYQKVDFEFASDLIKKKKKSTNDSNLFDNLILEENFVEYNPKNTNNKLKKKNNLFITEEIIESSKRIRGMENQTDCTKKKMINLKEIYDEFWEFIDNDNNDFKEFIQSDPRRKNI